MRETRFDSGCTRHTGALGSVACARMETAGESVSLGLTMRALRATGASPGDTARLTRQVLSLMANPRNRPGEG